MESGAVGRQARRRPSRTPERDGPPAGTKNRSLSMEPGPNLMGGCTTMAAMERDLLNLVTESGFETTDRVGFPSRKPRYLRVPDRLHPALRSLLEADQPAGLYSHQVAAMERVWDGSDVCLATSTASGKSLVFMTLAADLLINGPTPTVLAVYPAKALIQDQLAKWQQMLKAVDHRPGYIDGAVPTSERPAILREHRVVLMTPDVTHAWLMSNLQMKEVRWFLERLHLLILDEVHVYDGVFGSNVAYFLRRLQAVSNLARIVSSTATIGEPANFVENLTGRRPVVFAGADDGAPTPKKTVFMVRPTGGNAMDRLVGLLKGLARSGVGRFLAFGDSRKMVEQVVSIAQRIGGRSHVVDDDEETNGEDGDDDGDALKGSEMLPFRAGYEEEDRKEIQESLARGDLAGVVSTSALELGLDIGDIDLVVLLTTPPTVKAFRQRLGRAGRRSEGYCLLIDDRGVISNMPGRLRGYVARRPEPGWLYLDNRYIQYSHALCAAIEAAEANPSTYKKHPFNSLPQDFARLLENELNPTETVPADLYALKQRAQAGPQYEFPLRSGVEQNFKVQSSRGPIGGRLGTLAYSQALREAYPGSIYYYMARPYRVYQFNYRTGEIWVRREKRWTTTPNMQSKVFPKLPGGVFALSRSEKGFLLEAELQVSERVLGFSEHRGGKTTAVMYEPGGAYAQRPVNRFFETTGVCWYSPRKNLVSEGVAQRLLQSFCHLCGIQERDLGAGTFFAKSSTIWDAQCQGMCIYDAAHGSLRLTKQLLERFQEVVDASIGLLSRREQSQDTGLERSIRALSGFVETLKPATPRLSEEREVSEQWVRIVAPGEKAMFVDGARSEEVVVLGCRYTPQGLMYKLEPSQTAIERWQVSEAHVIPIHGVTGLTSLNLMTGELKDDPK
ncbi:MAG: DEAD/DEAH box helicase [Candidatus Eisenbacteria bacterium]|nr:DEAD/DEAH box helicase [Candidatus Eisenbacteria bacterium]